MKHLDELLDSLKSPVDIVQAWCDADKDRAVVACWKDIRDPDGELCWKRIEILEDAYHDAWFHEQVAIMNLINEEILLAESEDRKPDIDYENLYLPLEHIINDRIDFYNRG